MRLIMGRLLRRFTAKTREGRLWFPRATPLHVLWITLALPLAAQGGPDSAASMVQPVLPIAEVTAEAPGPTVAFVAGVHGGKVAAIDAVFELRRRLPGRLLRGRVLLVAPANVAGNFAGLAQTSPHDSLNLNRVFPGRRDGRYTERLAARIMDDIVAHSDYLVDLHGSDGDEAVGSFAYAARPGVAPRVDSAARALAVAWGTPVIVWDEGGPRTLAESRFLQTAAHLSGVPAITVFEAGDTRIDARATAAFVAGALRVLTSLEMLAPGDAAQRETPSSGPDSGAPAALAPAVLARRAVVVAPAAATWRPSTAPGARLAPGELAGWLRSSSGEETAVRTPDGGLVLHLRKAGRVPAGTPLVITGLAATP